MDSAGVLTAYNSQLAATKSSTGSIAGSSDFQMFLKMLTAQMKNQDPMKPIDSTDYATQLATFSGVEQQVRTNDLLAQMAGQFGGGGIAQFASWVGMEARAPVAAPFSGSPITLFASPDQTADQAILVGYDQQGNAITRQPIGVAPGEVQWSGKLADGRTAAGGVYRFKVESYAQGQLVATSDAETYVRISEVQQSTDGLRLLMVGGDLVAPDSVTALREAG